jgi:hypothetical protein
MGVSFEGRASRMVMTTRWSGLCRKFGQVKQGRNQTALALAVR